MAVLEPLSKTQNDAGVSYIVVGGLAAVLHVEELWSRSVLFELQQTTVRAASIPDLIHLKRLAGRAIDQANIEHLEAILRSRTGRDDD